MRAVTPSPFVTMSLEQEGSLAPQESSPLALEPVVALISVFDATGG